MMLDVMVNFDQLNCQFFQNFVLSSQSHSFNEIWLNFESHLLKMSF